MVLQTANTGTSLFLPKPPNMIASKHREHRCAVKMYFKPRILTDFYPRDPLITTWVNSHIPDECTLDVPSIYKTLADMHTLIGGDPDLHRCVSCRSTATEPGVATPFPGHALFYVHCGTLACENRILTLVTRLTSWGRQRFCFRCIEVVPQKCKRCPSCKLRFCTRDCWSKHTCPRYP